MKTFYPLVCLVAGILATTGVPAFAQGLDGSDRPGNWRVTHTDKHGLWSSICDEREEGGALNQRCYMRYVDVFSGRPNFAAMFLFVTPEQDGMQVEFGIEPGTLFSPNGFRIQQGQDVAWRTRAPGCLTGLTCTFASDSAAPLLDAMNAGGEFRFVFVDRNGAAQDLTWSLDGFEKAFADFQEQSRARGLLPQG